MQKPMAPDGCDYGRRYGIGKSSWAIAEERAPGRRARGRDRGSNAPKTNGGKGERTERERGRDCVTESRDTTSGHQEPGAAEL